MLATISSGRIDHCGLEGQKMSVLMAKNEYDAGREVRVGIHTLCSGNHEEISLNVL